MKGKLSLLSAAVVMALAGTSADATQGTPVTKSSATPNPSRAHFKAPKGSTILYDQAISGSSVGFVDQNFSSANDPFDNAAADDFVVTGGGWNVSRVDLTGVYFNGSGPADSFDVTIYADAGGVPGAPVCSDPGLSYTNSGTSFSIPLSSVCALSAGTYWLSAVANMDFAVGGEFGWSAFAPASLPGSVGKWQNPGDGFGTGCTSWGDVDTCLSFPGTNSFGFQIVGSTGTGGTGISLTVGLAEDNGDPNQCGTATTLSATAGDQINFCYTVTNNSSIALNYQSLADDVDGTIFTNMPQTIAPGGSFQYNRMVTAGSSESPTSTWTAADALPGYTPSAGSASFVDISTSGTALSLGDDTSQNVTMPFSFNFYGQTSNELCIDNNAFMEFGLSSSCAFSVNWVNSSLPFAGFEAPTIMPFWDDLYTGGSVLYSTVGTSPNRQFVVEWFNKDTFDTQGANPGYTFEAIFNEADNSLDFLYQNMTGVDAAHDGGLSATVGLQYDTTLANQYSFDTASLTNGQDIHWTASSPTVYTDSQQVTLDVGAPVLTLNPTTLSGTADAGTTTTTTLTIGNTGDRDLTWDLTEAPANAHFPVTPRIVVPFHSPEQTSRRRAPDRRHIDPKDLKPQLTKHAQLPLGGDTVPAFAETFSSSGLFYGNFPDVGTDGTFNQIADLGFSTYYFAGTFADNDFNTEYVVDYPAGTLYAVSTADGSAQSIGNTGLGGNVTGIRWDSSTGNAFAMAYDSGSGNSCLNSLDLTTGATQQIGCASGTLIIDIAIDPSGAMYGVDIISDALVAIDKTTGAAQAIGSIGFNANFAQGMDFDAATGTLYLAGYDGDISSGGIYTVDLTTGLATKLFSIPETDAFAIAVASGPCATPADVPWLSESPTSGTTTAGNSTDVTVTMDATSLTAGTYNANVCVNTNDQTQRHVAVPVTFTVNGGNDTIFKDGFDGQ